MTRNRIYLVLFALLPAAIVLSGVYVYVVRAADVQPKASGQAAATATPMPAGVPFSVAPGAVATPGGQLPGNPSIELVKVADGFADPINVVSPPDGSGRLFVVERPGRVRVVQDGQVMEEPFLDITELTLSAFLEQGLYDLEFHPDFAENGRFYVHFAELLRNGDSMIVEYQVSADDPNRADPESARVILQIEQPYANHNGGELAFGPDGYLYIGSGDGGWEGDPLEAGQDLSTLLGKILRIDVNMEGTQPYTIPEDNPFAQPARLVQLFGIDEDTFAGIHTEARPEIWAYGLRNPWKFQFDRETGDLYIADVGQNHWEEINVQPADSPGGENYGWDLLMGSHCFPIEQEQCASVGVLPVAEYSHSLGCAVVGFGVYRGDEFPALDGIYFLGDYCSGRVWGMARNGEGEESSWAFQELLDTELQFTGAGADEAGNLYVTSCECNYGQANALENPPGALWRLVPSDAVPADAETAVHVEGMTTEETAGMAQELWQMMQEVNYREAWTTIPGKGELYPGQHPHGALLSTYLNPAAEEGRTSASGAMPEDSIIVKENYMGDGTLASITIMYKEPGFDPAHNDWFWAQYAADGAVQAAGQAPGCIACHGAVSTNDYVFTFPVAPIEAAAVEMDAEVESMAQELWQELEEANYAEEWATIPGKGELYPGQEPHGALLSTYLNSAAEEGMMAQSGLMPEDAIIVKENYMADQTLAGLTVMYKEPGFDPEHNDWFWAKYAANGTVEEAGKAQGCVACHGAVRSNDYVFTFPIAPISPTENPTE